MPKRRWMPESRDEDALCTTARLGRTHADDRWCVHLKGHEGRHHFEGDLVDEEEQTDAR